MIGVFDADQRQSEGFDISQSKLRVDALQSGSSPYASGGGGFVLEHAYGALALTSLLLGDPMIGLGDEYKVTSVAMQQESLSSVDDLLVTGRIADSERTIRIACRRRPTIGSSSTATVNLFGDFLKSMFSDIEAVDRGDLRLGLAVSGHFGPAAEVASLGEVARRQATAAAFADAINAPGAHRKGLRQRLTNVRDIVRAALEVIEVRADDQKQTETTWSLLKALFVLQEELEGDVASAVTANIARLAPLTGSASRAADLHRRLVDIASQSCIRAGSMNRSMLRRELRSFGQLGASPDFAAARPQVELLEAALLHRTQRSIPRLHGGQPFSLDRSSLLCELVAAIDSLASGGVLLVFGEPYVGKSVLALDAVDSIRSSGGDAIAVSLRDLPPDVLNFKSLLGSTPVDLLSSVPSGPKSVLLLDGAEVVQERDDRVVPSLIAAAASAGLSTVLVTRDDAKGTLVDVIRRFGQADPQQFVVPAVSDEESLSLLQAIPELAPLSRDLRAGWLLQRLGIVNQLMRSTLREDEMPSSLSTEAEVAQIYWQANVRNSERTVDGVSPDERDGAVVAVAKSILAGTAVPAIPGRALSTLRSDGILLSRDSASAWRSSDTFASDILRDFAVAIMLVREGLDVLTGSSAPRWAIRATRLYAQERLAEAITSSDCAILQSWTQVRTEFDVLSLTHGARWTEVLWEAVLTAGWIYRLLSAITPALKSDQSQLDEALSCLKLRFSSSGTCDPVIGAPLLTWVLDNCDVAAAFDSYDDNPVRELVLSWLRGMASPESASRDRTSLKSLRIRVRDLLVEWETGCRAEEEWLECLGLFVDDANNAVKQVLRRFAKEHPAFLAPLVESPDVAQSLAIHDSTLLADVAEAYYIEQPSDDPWEDSLLDEGIRHHIGRGFWDPLAAWYRGPFAFLLREDFSSGLRLIDKMLYTGARRRVVVLNRLRSYAQDASSDEGQWLDLDLMGQGTKRFIGDAHVWSWYRGSSVGPYPCMSALFSLELMMDIYVRAGVAVGDVARRVLRDASTLASAGLVCGFLVRHIDKVTEELDGYLSRPEIWDLEIGRVVSEGILHVQGPDPDEIDGQDRRRWTPHTVVSQLVLKAMASGDDVTLDRLKSVGDHLLEAAGGVSAPPFIRQWVAGFDPSCYSFKEAEGGLLVEMKPGEEVEQALAVEREHSAMVMEMYRVQDRYRLRQLTPYGLGFAKTASESELAHDFEVARNIQKGLRDEPLDSVRSALAGIAAAILESSAAGFVTIEGSIDWALEILVDSALNPYRGDFPVWNSMFSGGSDRTAAFALPCALLPTIKGRTGRREKAVETVLVEALAAGSSSLFIEVRMYATEGFRRVLRQACVQPGSICQAHEAVWGAIEAGARRVTLGQRTQDGSRGIEEIGGDLIAELSGISGEELMLPHLMAACIAVLDAESSSTCISGEAGRLLPVLLDAYGRAACYWAQHDYGERDDWRPSLASALLRYAGDDAERVLAMVNRLKPAPRALANYLSDLQVVATYEPSAVDVLTAVWPSLMELALETLGREQELSERHAREDLVKEMVPCPSPSLFFGDFEEALAKARSNWLTIDAVTGRIEDWLQLARGKMSCVDQLVGFLESQPLGVQIGHGLSWIRALVVRGDGTAYTSGILLVGWLTHLRDARDPIVKSSGDYKAIIDALVLSNYAGARKLQARDE